MTVSWGGRIFSLRRSQCATQCPSFLPSMSFLCHYPAFTCLDSFGNGCSGGFALSATRSVRHWARKASFDRLWRLPNRALRPGSCAAPSPYYPAECRVFGGTHKAFRSGATKGGSLGFNGDFRLRSSPNGGFILAPPYPVPRNDSLQSKQTKHRQEIAGAEWRAKVSLSPKPWGMYGAWTEVWQRLSHRRSRMSRGTQHVRQSSTYPQRLS